MRIALHLFFRCEEKASRNIGVHAGSAYLLAVLVDDKRIYIFKSDLRHSRGSLFKQFRLAGEDRNIFNTDWFESKSWEPWCSPAIRVYRGNFAAYMDGETNRGVIVDKDMGEENGG